MDSSSVVFVALAGVYLLGIALVSWPAVRDSLRDLVRGVPVRTVRDERRDTADGGSS